MNEGGVDHLWNVIYRFCYNALGGMAGGKGIYDKFKTGGVTPKEEEYGRPEASPCSVN